jgi:hypothetical protein
VHDALLNSAGILWKALLDQTTLEMWNELSAVSLVTQSAPRASAAIMIGIVTLTRALPPGLPDDPIRVDVDPGTADMPMVLGSDKVLSRWVLATDQGALHPLGL